MRSPYNESLRGSHEDYNQSIRCATANPALILLKLLELSDHSGLHLREVSEIPGTPSNSAPLFLFLAGDLETHLVGRARYGKQATVH